MADIILDIGGNTSRLDRDIQKTVNKVYNINLKTKGDQPLGRITGKVNEFTKSLDASNARVIAFGASAGIIYGLQRAFTALVSSSIEVQKSLQDINVILNASASDLQKFGAQLFNIAKNTGQGFQEVAKAATEFSRQGLGVEETLKRTNDALILSRLSGLDAAKSVEALTAAINSFAGEAVTASEVINKFANVDAAFAVSSADLAEAISRVGSSAAQSGVSLNELIAIVTSAQQTTARGGAVIGNSFKTIFTRLERGKVQDLLSSLGISTTDSSGQLKSTIQLLQDLGKVYDTLGSQQKAYVAEQVGGVFQINILKAALADLGKEYSIYNNALNVAAGSTDQAIKRNEELNKTYAAQINALQENARQLAAAAGERLLGPSVDRLVGGTNAILGGLNADEGKGFGAQLGKGILDGIGQFISGPGLVLIGGVLLKLFKDLGKFATGSFQQLLGLNTSATQQRDLQQSINQILQKNPQLIDLALKGEQGLNAAASQLLANLQKQTIELQKQEQVAAQLSKAFMQSGVRVSGGIPVAPIKKAGKAAGYIPNFASDKQIEKAQAIALGATTSVRAHMSEGTIDGKKFVMNNQEIEYPGVGKNGDSMVIPMYGDGPKIAAKGYIPNFARTGFTIGGIYAKEPSQAKIDKISDKEEDGLENQAKKLITEYTSKYTNTLKPLGRTVTPAEIEQGFNTVAGAKGALNGLIGSMFEVGINTALDYKSAAREKGGDFDIRGGANLSKIQELFGINTPLADFKVNASAGNIKSFIDKILSEEGAGKFEDTEIIRNTQQIAKRELKAIDEKEALRLGIVDSNGKGISGKDWFPKGTGRGYELRQKIPNASPETVAKIQKIYNERLSEAKGRFGYLGTEGYQNIQKQGVPQKLSKGGTGEPGSQKPASYWASKYSYLVPPFAKPGAGTLISYTPQQGKGGKAAGYIPNFAALQDAISREREAGVANGRIYIAQDKRLAAAGYNPFGLGVFNTRDEPTSGARSRAIKNRGYASGYIPNFAITDIDTEQADLKTIIATITAQLSGLAFAFAFSKDDYKNSLKEITEANKNAGKVMRQISAEQKAQFYKEAKASGEPGAVLKAQEKIKEAQFAPSKGQKIGSFLSNNAFGLSIAAPILGETAKNLIGQETKGKRQAGTVASALGQVGSFAAMGGMIGQGPGAAIGAAVGTLASIPSVLEAFISDVPELEKAAKLATENLTKFSDAGQKYFTALQSLSDAIGKDGSGDQKLINQARKDYIDALSQLSVADQQALVQAERLGNAQEKYAELLEKKRQEESGAKAALSVESAVTSNISNQSLTRFLGGVPRLVAKAGDAFSGTIRDTLGMEKNDFFKNAVTAYTPDTAFNPDSVNAKVLEKSFLDLALAGKNGQDQINKLNEILKTLGTAGNVEKPEELKALLSKTIGEDTEGSRRLIESITKATTTGLTDDASRKKAVQEILSILISGASGQRTKTQGAMTSEEQGRAERENRVKYLKEEQSAMDAAIKSMQTNIAVINAWRGSLDNFSENARKFQEDLRISNEFTAPKEALGQIFQSTPGIVGASSLEKRYQVGGEMAKIQNDFASSVNDAMNEFKGSIRDAIGTPFQEGFDKIVSGVQSGSSFEGVTTEKIKTKGAEIRDQAGKEQSKLNDTMNSIETLMQQYVQGQISTQSFQQQSVAALQKVGIGVDASSKVGNDIQLAVAQSGTKLLAAAQVAQQQRKLLATEQVQKAIQDKIQQGLGLFGGLEGFMNRPTEAPEGEFKKIEPVLDAIRNIRSNVDFRYSNKESLEARKEKTPELARKYIELYQNFNKMSGGAFREELQKRVDNSNPLATSGRGGRVSSVGGFDDIIKGIKDDLEAQVKQYEDQISIEKDPGIKKDLEMFVKSIRNVGIDNAAKLQAMAATGVARQSDYEQTYGQFENSAIESLSKEFPNLAGELSKGIQFDPNNPLLTEASTQSALQGQMVNFLAGIQDAIIKTAQGRAEDIKGYNPEEMIKQMTAQADAGQAMENKTGAADLKQQKPEEFKPVDRQAKNMDDRFADWTIRESASQGKKLPTIEELKKMYPDYSGYMSPESQKLMGPQAVKDAGQLAEKTKPIEKSFTTQEAALSQNTTAMANLTTAINGLQSSLTTAQETKAAGGTTPQNTAAPNISTQTNAPVSVIVNADTETDLATAVGAAVKNAIPEIVRQVRAARGEKIPPSVPQPIVTETSGG